MASMILASSPLSAQSFVKLRTNSNYSHSPCFVSSVKNPYVHLPFKNISHIESSKSLFVKGDSNFSFQSPKFPRYSPSLNAAKGSHYASDIDVYGFYAYDENTGENFKLSDRYGKKNKILLFVNLPQEISSDYDYLEMEFLNDLRNIYTNQENIYGLGFEILGFFPRKKSKLRHPFTSHTKLAEGEEKIRKLAHFPIFRKVYKDNDHRHNDRNLWNFLRTSQNNGEMEGKFDKFLVDRYGNPVKYFPWFEGETLKSKMVKPGEFPGEFVPGRVLDPTSPVEDAIKGYFKK